MSNGDDMEMTAATTTSKEKKEKEKEKEEEDCHSFDPGSNPGPGAYLLFPIGKRK